MTTYGPFVVFVDKTNKQTNPLKNPTTSSEIHICITIHPKATRSERSLPLEAEGTQESTFLCGGTEGGGQGPWHPLDTEWERWGR